MDPRKKEKKNTHTHTQLIHIKHQKFRRNHTHSSNHRPTSVKHYTSTVSKEQANPSGEIFEFLLPSFTKTYIHHKNLLWRKPARADGRAGRGYLIPVHGHPLRVPAELSIGRRTDGSAPRVRGVTLLQGEQLLSAETLVVDLRCGFDQVLEMGSGQEVPQRDEFAMVFVFHVDDSPSILTTSHRSPTHDN